MDSTPFSLALSAHWIPNPSSLVNMGDSPFPPPLATMGASMESSDPVRDTDAETMRLGCCSMVMVVGCFAPLRVSIVRGNSADCAALFELSEDDVPSEFLDC